MGQKLSALTRCMYDLLSHVLGLCSIVTIGGSTAAARMINNPFISLVVMVLHS